MKADVVIIGGGFAGISAAFFLSKHVSVILLERESSIGTQSSARSAEQFTVGISANTMRPLGQASRVFLENPPPGFTDRGLLSPRGCLTVGRAEQIDRLQTLHDRIAGVGAGVRMVARDEALGLFPALLPDGVDIGVYEPGAADIDADALLQGYARGAKSQGAQIVTAAAVQAIRRMGGAWRLETTAGSIEASMILNAAGAWVDEVGALAGLRPLGLRPMRRTAFTFSAPADRDTSHWPFVSNVDYKWYLKPETGRFMGSLAEEVLTPPGDVYPDDMDVAQAIYNIEQETTLQVGRPLSTWAGLRNFVADRNPVLGARSDAEGFFWLAGHGGCGVLSSPAMGQAAAAILLGRELPEALRDFGVSSADLSPDRPTLTSSARPNAASAQTTQA